MRIYDIAFYIFLCAVVIFTMFVNMRKSDLSFHNNTINLESYPIFEHVFIANDKKISSLNINRLKDNEYLISYMADSNIYAIPFFPSRYSMKDSNGKWSNAIVADKMWGEPFMLLEQETLLKEIGLWSDKKRITSFMLQNSGDNLYMIANVNVAKKLNRAYIFKSNNLDFRFYKKPSIDFNAGLGYVFRSAFLESHSDYGIENSPNGNMNGYFIIPFDSTIGQKRVTFGIFDNRFNLKDIIRPNDLSNSNQASIIALPDNYKINITNDDKNNISYSCISAYQSANILNIQTCQSGNAILSFNDISQSGIGNIESFRLANIGFYPALIYTDDKGKTLNLAIWNGSDFEPLVIMDKDNHISNIAITSYGSYAYIAYIKDSDKSINIIFLNEKYIYDLIENTSENLPSL